MSRPAWARELKQNLGVVSAGCNRSRPAWARELKLVGIIEKGKLIHVAPRVGA